MNRPMDRLQAEPQGLQIQTLRTMEDSPHPSTMKDDPSLDQVPQSLHQDQNQQSSECSGPSPVQDVDQIQDYVDGASPQHQDQAEHLSFDLDQNQEHHQTANQDEAGESGGSVPSLVVTEAEESLHPPPAAPVTPVEAAAPQKPERPSDLAIPASTGAMTEPILSSGSDGGDMTCSDLMSLRSDSISLASEPTVSRRSEDDDTRSVAASSVMSLFHRLQLDPLEKDWMRSCALGNMAAQRQLLAQEPGLVLKKDFITGFTALHWAAKQGRQEAVDMMLRSGADVNVRSHGGYTALHLASIHGDQDIIRSLISTYNAKTNIRDYHGKRAEHYWSGSSDVFNKPDPQSGRFCRSRRTHRYVLPSLLLSRSRSQGQLNLDFTLPQSTSHEALDLYV